MFAVARYGPTLPPHVRAQVLEGLDHFAELTAIDAVLPPIEAFLLDGR